MAIEVIIVTDAPPLITLAAARSLDYLLYPALPVIIPDAVFHEATGTAGKLGAQEILDWYRAHMDLARVEPTQVFQDEMTLRENPGHKPARDCPPAPVQEADGEPCLHAHSAALRPPAPGTQRRRGGEN
jgi:hypothetical protein